MARCPSPGGRTSRPTGASDSSLGDGRSPPGNESFIARGPVSVVGVLIVGWAAVQINPRDSQSDELALSCLGSNRCEGPHADRR